MNASPDKELKLTTPDDVTIVMEREFDAPPELVWEAWTKPELLAVWLGPKEHAMVIDEFDFRVGGKWRYHGGEPGGEQFHFFGEFRVIEEPRVLEQTFNFAPVPSESIDHVELVPLEGGRTRLVSTSTFESKEMRDGMIQSGMEKGVVEGYEKLDAILAERQAG